MFIKPDSHKENVTSLNKFNLDIKLQTLKD